MFGEEREPTAGEVRAAGTRSPDSPHAADGLDAGTGQGTVHDAHYGARTLDHPVLDGSTETAGSQAKTENPYRGISDPALVHGHRHHAHPADER